MEVKFGRIEGKDNWPKKVKINPPFEQVEKYFKKGEFKNFSKVDVESLQLVRALVIEPFQEVFINEQSEDAFHLIVANYRWKKIFIPLSEKLRQVQNEKRKEVEEAKKWLEENKLFTYLKHFAPSFYPEEVKAHDVVKSISFKLKEGQTLTIKNPLFVKEVFECFAEIIGEFENEKGIKREVPKPFIQTNNFRKLDMKNRIAYIKGIDSILKNEPELFHCKKTKDRLVLLGAFLACSGDLKLKNEYEEGNDYKEEIRFQQNLKTEYEAYLYEEAREVLRKK